MATVLKLNNTGSIYFLEVDADPSLVATLLPNGESVPVGSIACANLAGVGKAWIKTTVLDTGFSEFDQNAADWSLAGNALSGATALTPNEVFGSTTDYDVRYIRNNSERMRIANEGVVFHNNKYGNYSSLPAQFRTSMMSIQKVSESMISTCMLADSGGSPSNAIGRWAATRALTTAAVSGSMNLGEFLPNMDSSVALRVEVIGRQIGGSSGALGNTFHYVINGTLKNVAGVLTVKSQSSISQYEEDSASSYNVTLTVISGNQITATITQPANRIVKWSAIFDIIQNWN